MTHQQFDPTDWTLIDSPDALSMGADLLHAGSGPIGVDAERASGFKYFPSAYLIQVSRRGAGTFVIDPTQIDDFSPLIAAMQGEEWILHAAIADLESLRERGLDPEHLFDTEVAARLLGFERVNLGAIIHELFGIELAKAHSASDWSVRPLPDAWLEYAAADVVFLPEIRDRMGDLLEISGKLEFAIQEFDALLTKPERTPRDEPWRRLSRITSVKDRRSLAVARELWMARDDFARAEDIAPGRLLPDASIISAALQAPRSPAELAKNKEFRGRASRSELDRWWRAILRGKQTESLPSLKAPPTGAIPHHRYWERKKPEAFERLQRARHLIELEAERLQIPLENLLTPSVLREIAWAPPATTSAESITGKLLELGARPWQTEATAHLIAASFVDSP